MIFNILCLLVQPDVLQTFSHRSQINIVFKKVQLIRKSLSNNPAVFYFMIVRNFPVFVTTTRVFGIDTGLVAQVSQGLFVCLFVCLYVQS